jgi:diguanylate cyclase (GGDEF)-like protein
MDDARVGGERAPELDAVRFRLILLLAATGLLSGLAGSVIVTIVPSLQPLLLAALGRVPIPLYALLVAIVAGAIKLVASLARRVVDPSEALARSRGELHELYTAERTNALVDSLTGLGNHRAFQEEFDRQLSQSLRYGTPLTLVLIDLDDFKQVNDSAGHSVGDELLAEVGRLVMGVVRRADRAFRVGGDEFALLLPHTDAPSAEIVARRLLVSAVEQRPGGQFTKPFSFSAGLASAPEHGTNRPELYAHADAALYDAKRHGRTAVRVFDPRQQRPTLDAATLASHSAAVAEVVRVAALRPVYQPIVDLASGRVTGFEGLVRPLPETGFSDPGSLFSIAEATGRTFELDHTSIETLAAGATDLAPWQTLSLNLSPRTLETPEFSPAGLARLLARHGFTPGRVVLELTEREALEDVERLRSMLAGCRSLGFRVAADDVGAGNAGLRLLSAVHFDIVKLDLSLVQAGSRQDSSLAVLRSLTELAARWGSVAVAEGIETAAQLHVVREIGIAEGQGYLLGRPSESATARQVDIEALLKPDRLAFLGQPLVLGGAT